ncbi:MAG: GAF domain-containing protein [Burkholderiales bacterium]|jgi:HD-GYP domain-containing protein (c-di-GMP phosphodiesterase class II)|nr:GAF domain-containing protein [Burkholderiales bacterium]
MAQAILSAERGRASADPAGTADGLFLRLERLNEIGAALSLEKHLGALLEKILIAAKTITRADGGTLYLIEGEGDAQQLRFEIVRTASLGIALGGTTGKPIAFAPLPLYREGQPNTGMVAAYAALTGRTVDIADAYTEAGFDFSGTREFDQRTGYRSKSFLTVPMKNHSGELVGVLQLINCRDPDTGGIVPFAETDRRLAESLASQAAIAITNRQLIDQLETLFESFIALINEAIDEKSPYTGGHCQRVPTLTMLLAEAVNETTEGPLASFAMSDQDRYELRIAGLLHDCGKITTPVHIVDKATKLETIFDRIHLVDTRFEVLRRDAEIESLKAKLELARTPGLDEIAMRERKYRLDRELADRLRRLDDDREFLRRANMGAEAMSRDDQERVRAIAGSYKWRDPSGATANFLSDDEVANLTIRSGTLTPDEREIINHHIVSTIKMLEALPWPKHLRNVPEYAGGHHERMDGKGYPRGLKREDMSVQARVMGIADIFEALTAKDRPYKKGKTLTEALTILGKFSQNGHVDPDLFDVFVRRKVYLRYAEAFLDPEQIDVVDEAKIPGYKP